MNKPEDISRINALKHHRPTTLPLTAKCAAVMVIFLDNGNGIYEIVLTERSHDLKRYAGDFSFPGGMKDQPDADLYATAIRETQEELNIDLSNQPYLTQLDDFIDRFGHLVRPFVTIIDKPQFEKSLQIAKQEITRVYYFPLSKLPDININPEMSTLTRRHPSYTYTDDQVFVWGLTASILVHLRNILYAENQPVGHIPSLN